MTMSVITGVALVLSFYVLEVVCKKHHHDLDSIEDKIGLHHHGFSIFGVLLALKVKAVLVVLAIWGGVVITAKLFLAILWPFLSSLGHKCPFKDHGHHHGFEFETPYFAKADDIETLDSPPDHYGYKRWNRRTQRKNQTSLYGYR